MPLGFTNLQRRRGTFDYLLSGNQSSQQLTLPGIEPLNPPQAQNPTAPFQGFGNITMPSGSEWEIPPEIDALYQKYSQKYGVPLNEVRAIGYQESRHGRNPTSSAGAIGVMQLMPGTARELGVDPNNLEQNIEGGVRYYAQMRRQFGGNVAHAMGAYNAGPGRMRSWLQGQGKPLTKETTDYMRLVPRWAQLYQR